MCGRIAQKTSSAELAGLFDAADRADTPGDRFNVAPTQLVITLTVDEHGDRSLSPFRWGLVPPWAADPRAGARMFNARAETVADKPSYRGPFRRSRCIVPVDAFYEWQKVAGGKVPHAIVPTDGRQFALAGLWDTWRNQETGAEVANCTIVTTTPNDVMSPLHDRMPVILGADDWTAWLDPTNRDVDELRALLRPCPDAWLRAYPVTRLVNHVANDGAEVLVPATP